MKESCYIEVVPDAYFQAKEGEEYMFFVKNKKQWKFIMMRMECEGFR